MALPDRLRRYLDRCRVPAEVVSHAPTSRIQRAAQLAGIDPAVLARGVLLSTPTGPGLAVLPSDRLLNFCRVEAVLGRTVELVPPTELARSFPDCRPHTTPTLGPAYGLETVIEADLEGHEHVYLAVGRDDLLLRVDREGFQQLFRGCARDTISRCPAGVGVDASARLRARREAEFLPDERTRACLERLYALPPLPQVAAAVLQLQDDPNATPERLAELVAMDPSLAAQILRYARSAYFGYRGEVKDLTDAIHRVLGFEMVANIAVGLSAGGMFRNPEGGPLGLRAFWRHSALAACMSRSLAQAMPVERRPRPGLVYLAGLLHDFGFLVLGHLFVPEFTVLNRMAAANPDIPITALEQRLMAMGEARHMVGMGNARLGAWLMRRWDLPDELVVTLAEHHNPDYDGPHADYPLLVLLSNHLIDRLEPRSPAAVPAPLPSALMERLGLSAAAVQRVLEKVEASREEIEATVRPSAA